MTPSFEDALLIALEIMEKSDSRNEAIRKIRYILSAYQERTFYDKLDKIKRELGIWKNIP